MAADPAHEASAFVFHRVPDNLRGTTLYPLNELANLYPDLYTELRTRYATREDIAALRIPPLGGCLWNDVLHFSPVHPARIKQALADAGHAMPPGWNRYFKIDTRLLEPARAVIYRLQTFLWSGQFDVDEASLQLGRECVPFEPQSLHRYAEVPDAVRRYYASVEPGSDLALFLGIPHVLYRGRIDLTFEGVEIVDV